MSRKHNAICDRDQLWNRHEKLYKDVFYEALCLIEIADAKNSNEDSISEELNLKLRVACFNNKHHPQLPFWEGPISPTSRKDLKGGSKGKRPDFTCSIVDPFSISPEEYSISLHIECKKLGTAKVSWNLNKNYVEKGIQRFDSLTHRYGQGADSGFMIGYVVSSKVALILKEVNTHLMPGLLSLQFKLSSKVEICSSKFARSNIAPSRFRLIHIWADLRSNKARCEGRE